MLTKAERTKQFILETAVPIFNEKGIAGANIDDVLEATKLTKGCLYGHFEGKDDLSEQVIDLALKMVSDKIRAEVYKGNTVKAKIFAFLDFYKNPIETFISGGCPIFNTAVQVDDSYPFIKEKVAKVIKIGQQELTSLLQEGINNGEFSKTLDPVVFAFKLVASVEGGIVMCRVMDTAKPMQGLIKSLKTELEQYAV